MEGDDEDDGRHEGIGHQPDGGVHLTDDAAPPGGSAIGLGGRPHLAGLVALGGEGLDGADPGERLEEAGPDIAWRSATRRETR